MKILLKRCKILTPTEVYKRDTAQLLNYYYSIGSGGIVHKRDNYSAKQEELDYLINCYTIAKKKWLYLWEANSLQSISESLSNPETGKTLCNE